MKTNCLLQWLPSRASANSILFKVVGNFLCFCASLSLLCAHTHAKTTSSGLWAVQCITALIKWPCSAHFDLHGCQCPLTEARDSLAGSGVLEDRGQRRSSGESSEVLCPHPLALTAISCVLMSLFFSPSLCFSAQMCFYSSNVSQAALLHIWCCLFDVSGHFNVRCKWFMGFWLKLAAPILCLGKYSNVAMQHHTTQPWFVCLFVAKSNTNTSSDYWLYV